MWLTESCWATNAIRSAAWTPAARTKTPRMTFAGAGRLFGIALGTVDHKFLAYLFVEEHFLAIERNGRSLDETGDRRQGAWFGEGFVHRHSCRHHDAQPGSRSVRARHELTGAREIEFEAVGGDGGRVFQSIRVDVFHDAVAVRVDAESAV